MRSLRITLHTHKPVILPLAYNELIQGLLYSCWREQAPELHDDGYGSGPASYRLFSFGPLRGKGRIDVKNRTYCLEDLVTFEVRTPLEDLLDTLAGELAAKGTARIGAYDFAVVNLEACDRLLFPRRTLIHMLQPLVIRRNTEDGKTHYLSPDDEGWFHLIQTNAIGKAEAVGLACSTELQLMPLSSDKMRKRVTRFKKTYITGWMGDYALSCNPQLMQLLYSCGLGSRNSQGFGLFEIDSRPL